LARNPFCTSLLLLVATPALAGAHRVESSGWGIASTPDGRIYFTDVNRGIVWRLDPQQDPEPALEGVETYALVTIADGSVYGADAGARPPAGRAWRIDPDGRVHPLIDAGETRLGFVSFLIDTDGTIYSASRAGTELLRRRPDGSVDRVAGGFTAINGMAWAPDGGILATDGPYLKYVAQDGSIDTIGGGPLSESRGDVDLGGVTTNGSGGAFAADSAGGRLLNVGRHAGVAVEYGADPPWVPSGVARDAHGLVVLETLAARWSALAELQIGPYLRVRRLGVDGQVVTLAVLWGTRTWMAAAAVAGAAAAAVLWHIRTYRGLRPLAQ
jgi:hypothetical protein